MSASSSSVQLAMSRLNAGTPPNSHTTEEDAVEALVNGNGKRKRDNELSDILGPRSLKSQRVDKHVPQHNYVDLRNPSDLTRFWKRTNPHAAEQSSKSTMRRELMAEVLQALRDTKDPVSTREVIEKKLHSVSDHLGQTNDIPTQIPVQGQRHAYVWKDFILDSLPTSLLLQCLQPESSVNGETTRTSTPSVVVDVPQNHSASYLSSAAESEFQKRKLPLFVQKAVARSPAASGAASEKQAQGSVWKSNSPLPAAPVVEVMSYQTRPPVIPEQVAATSPAGLPSSQGTRSPSRSAWGLRKEPLRVLRHKKAGWYTIGSISTIDEPMPPAEPIAISDTQLSEVGIDFLCRYIAFCDENHRNSSIAQRMRSLAAKTPDITVEQWQKYYNIYRATIHLSSDNLRNPGLYRPSQNGERRSRGLTDETESSMESTLSD